MSTPKSPDPAKLVLGCIMNDRALIDQVYPVLENAFGPVDMLSAWLDFEYTDHGQSEPSRSDIGAKPDI